MTTLRVSAFTLCSLLFSGAALLHCGGDDTNTQDDSDDSGAADASSVDGAVTSDGAPNDAGVTPIVDASLTDFCKAALANSLACGYPICADGGSTNAVLCDAFDNDINSANQRQATITCESDAGDASCDQIAERDCENDYFRSATITAAGTKLAADYCSTCESGNAGCPAAAVANLDGGESFIFGDAWGLSDSVLGAVDTKCTGGALPLDAGTCAESFQNCAQGVFFALPSFAGYANCAP